MSYFNKAGELVQKDKQSSSDEADGKTWIKEDTISRLCEKYGIAKPTNEGRSTSNEYEKLKSQLYLDITKDKPTTTTNKKFLENIISNTNSHNNALLKKQKDKSIKAMAKDFPDEIDSNDGLATTNSSSFKEEEKIKSKLYSASSIIDSVSSDRHEYRVDPSEKDTDFVDYYQSLGKKNSYKKEEKCDDDQGNELIDYYKDLGRTKGQISSWNPKKELFNIGGGKSKEMTTDGERINGPSVTDRGISVDSTESGEVLSSDYGDSKGKRHPRRDVESSEEGHYVKKKSRKRKRSETPSSSSDDEDTHRQRKKKKKSKKKSKKKKKSNR